MLRVLSGGIRILAFALMALLVLVSRYSWEAGAVCLALTGCYVIGRQVRRERVFGLDVKAMSPAEYEEFCAEALRRAGWRVSHVGRQGDQGVDVVAEMRGIKAAVQCKRWSGKSGVDGVQQVVAGKRVYGAQVAVVVAPFGHTRAAYELAKANSAFLMSHQDLARLESIARVP